MRREKPSKMSIVPTPHIDPVTRNQTILLRNYEVWKNQLEKNNDLKEVCSSMNVNLEKSIIVTRSRFSLLEMSKGGNNTLRNVTSSTQNQNRNLMNRILPASTNRILRPKDKRYEIKLVYPSLIEDADKIASTVTFNKFPPEKFQFYYPSVTNEFRRQASRMIEKVSCFPNEAMPKPMLQPILPVPRPLPESQPEDQFKLPLTKGPLLEEKCMDKTSHIFKRKSISSISKSIPSISKSIPSISKSIPSSPQPNIRSEDPRTDLSIGSHIKNSAINFVSSAPASKGLIFPWRKVKQRLICISINLHFILRFYNMFSTTLGKLKNDLQTRTLSCLDIFKYIILSSAKLLRDFVLFMYDSI
ncbi:hypothetical protein CDAR_194771 [Caerostris darwini]|uniref:Uncharacterized protein n=1 Tax=Caerostris darwini TaxID=1538125 RepID=A0AAV4X5H6_9ARAC|nr:hypothetical protein CDAR_194771 [Caerostris darwini]